MDALYATAPLLYTAIGGIVALLVGLGLWVTGTQDGRARQAAAIATLGIGAVALVGSIAVDDVLTIKIRSEAVQDVYGVTLDGRQVSELRFPAFEPSGLPQVFGSTEVQSEGLTVTTARLAWDGKQLILVDDTGAELAHR